MNVDTEFAGLEKMPNFMFNKLTFAKSEFVKLLSNFAFFTCKCIFGVGMPHSCTGTFPRKEGAI
jgi:hypothetical protein